MQVTEIYSSIQGESSFAGLPCIFVRLTGCNLRCNWCDSEYTFTGGVKMSVDEVMGEVRRLSPVKLVEITGGEPMLQQREVLPLMQQLVADGYTVLLETSGERPLATVPVEVIKIVDVKCPDSGEENSFDLANLAATHRLMSQIIREGAVSACHDLSDGGLAVAVAEMCIASGLGMIVGAEQFMSETAFNESPGRYLVELPDPTQSAALAKRFADVADVVDIGLTQHLRKLTVTTAKERVLEISLDELTNAWRGTLDW